jgi:hypothetical protein
LPAIHLLPDGAVRTDTRHHAPLAAMRIDGDDYQILRNAGPQQPLWIVERENPTHILYFVGERWIRLIPWYPRPPLAATIRKPPASFVPEAIEDIPELSLLTDGTIFVGAKSFRQNDEIALQFVVPWTLSKAAGAERELVLVNLHTTERRTYLYLEDRWCRRYRWGPVADPILFDTMWLNSQDIRHLDSLSVYDHDESLQFQVETPGGIAQVHKPVGEREFLSIRLPNGETQWFISYQQQWYQLVGSEYPYQLPPVQQPREKPRFSKYRLPDDKSPRRWRALSRSSEGVCDAAGNFVHADLPCILFAPRGVIRIGNKTFQPYEPIDEHFFHTHIQRGPQWQDHVQIECVPHDRILETDLSAKYRIYRFRHCGRWELLEERLPGFPLRQFATVVCTLLLLTALILNALRR